MDMVSKLLWSGCFENLAMQHGGNVVCGFSPSRFPHVGVPDGVAASIVRASSKA